MKNVFVHMMLCVILSMAIVYVLQDFSGFIAQKVNTVLLCVFTLNIYTDCRLTLKAKNTLLVSDCYLRRINETLFLMNEIK